MLIIRINAVIFFIVFGTIFIQIWSGAAKKYILSFEKKIEFHISKKQIIIFFISFLNLLLSIIVYYVFHS